MIYVTFDKNIFSKIVDGRHPLCVEFVLCVSVYTNETDVFVPC